jgi:hypothetical protein
MMCHHLVREVWYVCRPGEVAGRVCAAPVPNPVDALKEDATTDLFRCVFKLSVNVAFSPEMYRLLSTYTRCLCLR